MKVFLSYASDDRSAAEPIAFSLRARGHTVFLDRDDLPAGVSYDQQIEQAIARSDGLIFLISPSSVKLGRYTLTELQFARRKWRNPSGRVLPVMIAPTPMRDVPSYLQAVTILEPIGNVTAETASAFDAFGKVDSSYQTAWIFGITAAPIGLLASFLPVVTSSLLFGGGDFGLKIFSMLHCASPDMAILLGITTALCASLFSGVREKHNLVQIASITAVVGWLALSVFRAIYVGEIAVGPGIPNLDASDPAVRAALGDSADKLSATVSAASYVTTVVISVSLVSVSVCSSIVLLSFRTRSPLSLRDVKVALALGGAGGLIVGTSWLWGDYFAVIGDPKSLEGLHVGSSLGFMISGASWFASTCASVGFWITRNWH